jgi:xylulokinase
MSIYLGLDSSTQGLKAEIIDITSGKIICSQGVNFGKDLPEYKCFDGFLANDDPQIKHADPLVWLAAMDLLFSKLQEAGAPLSEIAGISGSGQQHGSVYLNNRFVEVVENLNPAKHLVPQIIPTLSRMTSPIWMDSSTVLECEELEEQFGTRMHEETGSPAIARFTGPQIRKFAKEDTLAYENTTLIHLVSSFLCSILCGKSAPIDHGDGAGMNLLNLKTLKWDEEICDFTAPGLYAKLPSLAPSYSIAGGLSEYFTKYGFQAGTPVAVWSGDNPNSLIGTGAASPGTAVISLGTSDTFFAAMQRPVTDPDGCGHVFGNPAGGFMSLICFTNGSLAREKVRDMCKVDWEYFDTQACNETAPGNNGNMILPYFTPENTPPVFVAKVVYQGSDDFCNGKASAAVMIRAILESQALTMRLHSSWMGEKFDRIRITGGASKSRDFRQILADVFQARIERITVTDSAGLGAAMRAVNAVANVPFSELEKMFAQTLDATEPNSNNAEVYDKALEAFKLFESNAIVD